MRLTCLAAAFGLALLAAVGRGQLPLVGPTDAAITVIDEQGEKHALDESTFAKLPQRKVDVRDGNVVQAYEGASLTDVLQHFGVEFGEQLKGRRAPAVVLCEAADDYRVAFALLEVDPATTDKLVLVANRCNGEPLAEDEGPFRIVVPDEKRRVRAIRMLRTIRVINLVDMPLTQRFDAPPAP